MGLRPTQGGEKRSVQQPLSIEPLPFPLSSRPEESWACGPPKVMKNASVQQPLSIEPLLFPLSSRPGFPAVRHWTRLRVRLSLKERRMRSVNATGFHRKSGGTKAVGEAW